jgi:hypothetical protein
LPTRPAATTGTDDDDLQELCEGIHSEVPVVERGVRVRVRTHEHVNFRVQLRQFEPHALMSVTRADSVGDAAHIPVIAPLYNGTSNKYTAPAATFIENDVVDVVPVP